MCGRQRDRDAAVAGTFEQGEEEGVGGGALPAAVDEKDGGVGRNGVTTEI